MIALILEAVKPSHCRTSRLKHNSSGSNTDLLLHIRKHGVLNCDMLHARFWQECLT